MIVDGIEIKKIPDFDGYFASADGNVWSNRPLNGIKFVGWQIEKPRLLSWYIRGRKRTVNMSVGGVITKKSVAWCVLTAWVSPRPKGMEICHGKNGRLDDSLENLRWDTPEENYLDLFRYNSILRGEMCSFSKLNELQVRIIRMTYRKGGIGGLSSLELGRIFNCDHKTILRCVKRYTWGHVI